jgi:hypothetical protein
MQDEITPHQRRQIAKHNGETNGKCRYCEREITPANPRYCGPEPYFEDVENRLVFMDGCAACCDDRAQDI